MYLLLIALILGVVEGLTEFLPISSTGHLILVSSLLGFEGQRAEVFQVFIQLGAILAVVWEYREKLNNLAWRLPRRGKAWRFSVAVGLAFVPSAVLGLMFYDEIVAWLFSPITVALALVVGGVLILIVEALPVRVRTTRIETVTWPQALGIGLAQCMALWPGFSRSAATILGGMVAGLDRKAATEFSFFLAIPTMFAATSYNLFRNLQWLEPSDLLALAVSFVLSFVVALVAIRWLLRYVATHGFRVFAWYRLVLGLVIFWVLR